MTPLDTLTPLQARVGFGNLGTGGSLGYEGKPVTVQGVVYQRAISAHAPARLLFYLGGGATTLRCRVALNDDTPAGASYADFVVVGDGRELASARNVWAGEAPRELEVDLSGQHLLELLTTTTRRDWCHSVWLDPELEGEPAPARTGTIHDCLARAEIDLPPELPPVERCVATVVSPGLEAMLDDMLGSLMANGNCADALVVVFLAGASPGADRVAAKYGAVPVVCRPLKPLGTAIKSVLYSVARVLDAQRYLCLDADLLVLDDLSPVFAAIDACPEGSVLCCREGNSNGYENVEHILWHAYGGVAADVERILGEDRGEGAYPLVVNDGVFGGSKAALLGLDGALRAMPRAIEFNDEKPSIGWRNQFLFNLALAHLDCGVELDETYNLQLHTSEVQVNGTGVRPDVRWQDKRVRILHSSGWPKDRVPQLKGVYGGVGDPLAGRGPGDAYGAYLATLRAWIGRYGLSSLILSFYGSHDTEAVRVSDPSTFPVLALLHYLVRASGCARVLETGTARGVSAACLAAAVAHRQHPRVVTFDIRTYPERDALWDALPAHMRACLEARTGDSVAGLQAALDAGERFDGALLDSDHGEDHLWAELELARRLVCPGGPILVHDWRWIDDIERVLVRAEEAGFGVARLLAGCGVDEDAGLGLAVIENRG